MLIEKGLSNFEVLFGTELNSSSSLIWRTILSDGKNEVETSINS